MNIIEKYINEIGSINSQKKLEKHFLATIKTMGYKAFDVYSIKTNTFNNPIQHSNFVISSYPINFIRKFIAKGFTAQCNDLLQAGKSNIAFDYIEYLRKHDNSASAVWQLRLFALNRVSHAWLVPFNMVSVSCGVTVYHTKKHNNTESFYSTRDSIQVLSRYFYEALLSFNPAKQQRKYVKIGLNHTLLSTREIECLSWSAKGKTSEIIAIILGISENTVRFHMKNIFKKLDVSSRPHAISKAASLNLL